MTIELQGIAYAYGTEPAVRGVDLSLEQGELVALLGPSGCGKTTLLKIIAGLLSGAQGRIFIDAEEVTLRPAQDRQAVMVFQNYALFPHLSVAGNIGYGLKMRGMGKKDREQAVREIMEKVELGGLGDRKIHSISGGQQQRVALARALVLKPRVLLFDEPLSNLDEKLRIAMRQEIRGIQQELGITSLYVTHDQEEAMAIADRIAVMRDGEIQQVGDPREVYENPVNAFVARFMGECNFLTGGGATLVCRPDTLVLDPLGDMAGTVVASEYLGSLVRYKVRVGEVVFVGETSSRQTFNNQLAAGEKIRFRIDRERCSVMGK